MYQEGKIAKKNLDQPPTVFNFLRWEITWYRLVYRLFFLQSAQKNADGRMNSVISR